MYISHLTIGTGHLSRIERGDVAGDALARVGPWLAALVASERAMPLPVAALAEYEARARSIRGALLLCVGRGPDVLADIAVAKRARHGDAVWPLISRGTTARRPAEPWCATRLLEAADEQLDAMLWLSDFGRCVAWVWCTRAEDQPGDA